MNCVQRRDNVYSSFKLTTNYTHVYFPVAMYMKMTIIKHFFTKKKYNGIAIEMGNHLNDYNHLKEIKSHYLGIVC